MVVPFIKNRIVFILSLIFIISSGIYGQVRTVSGVVTGSEDNQPVPGATVIVPGTTSGTVTNLEGFFSMNIPPDVDSLEFRFVGLATRRISVKGIDRLDVLLSPEIYKMEEVVVTALGISRDAKSLGYSVTAVNSENITKGNDRSVLNALQGKVAGVNITSASGAPGASTRILMRGVSSLTGSNQPLIVVNGVPVNNSQSGSSSINGGTDFGNKLNDINPDDIESISVLKGASGTVQYGSRAANGVIIITTKKGTKDVRSQINFNSAVSFEKPLRLADYQNEYGQGIYGNSVLYENMSWGPRFDNKFRPWGHNVDSSLRVKAYSALPDNVKEFFETGTTYSNSLSINGGTEQSTYYFSYSNVTSDGIFPTDADKYTKHAVTLNTSYQISKKLNTSVSVNYIRKKSSFVPTGQGGQSVYNQIMQTPRDISLRELSDINEKWNTIDNNYSLYTVNPYFILENNANESNEDRIFGSIDFGYKFLKNLDILWRVGGDVSNEHQKAWIERINPKGNNEFSAVSDPGRVSEGSAYESQINSDIIITYNYVSKNWTLDLMAGHNLNQRSSGGLGVTVSKLSLNDFPNLSNSVERPEANELSALKRLVGVYGNADISYRSLLFLSFNARNEWSSTLPPDANSYFFPGASIGLIFSEVFPGVKEILPFGKIRASWARVGNGAPPYAVYSVYTRGGHSDGYGYLSYPLANGVNSYDIGDLIANENLKPELTEEYETGAELKFFNNRFSIDFTYYHKSTTNLIWPSPVPYSSGYSNQWQNLGKLTNYGFEALTGITPVKTKKFEWVFSVNFTKNFNKLNYLNNQLENAELNALRADGGQQISWLAIPGEPVGVFKGRAPMYTSDGKMVVDNQGIPIADKELKIYGNSQYKYFGGISNQVTYKNITLSAMIDIRQGGIMYSRTKEITLWAGTVPATLYNDREPFIIPNSVVETGKDANGYPIYKENTKPIDRVQLVNYWGNGGSEIDGSSLIDKSFVKLREVILSYSIPEKVLKKLPVSKLDISVIGKNLLLFTPKDQTYIDPETTTFGNDLQADFGEYGATPSTRSITINLRVLF
jgi:TonB-linked SusC/RagA family outer membrane protein